MNKVWTGYVNTDLMASVGLSAGIQPATTYLMPAGNRTIRTMRFESSRYGCFRAGYRRVAFPNTIFTTIGRSGLLVNAIKEEVFTPETLCHPHPFSNTYSYGATCLRDEDAEEISLPPEEIIALFFSTAFSNERLKEKIRFQNPCRWPDCKNLEEWETITCQNPHAAQDLIVEPWFRLTFQFNSIIAPTPEFAPGDIVKTIQNTTAQVIRVFRVSLSTPFVYMTKTDELSTGPTFNNLTADELQLVKPSPLPEWKSVHPEVSI